MKSIPKMRSGPGHQMTWQGRSRTQSSRWSSRVTVPRWLHLAPRRRGQVGVMGTRGHEEH